MKQSIESWAEAGIKTLGIDCPACCYTNALSSDSCEKCGVALYEQDPEMSVEQIIALIESYRDRIAKRELSARQMYAHGRHEVDRQMAFHEIQRYTGQRLVLQQLLSEILKASKPMIVFPLQSGVMHGPRVTRPLPEDPLPEGDQHDKK